MRNVHLVDLDRAAEPTPVDVEFDEALTAIRPSGTATTAAETHDGRGAVVDGRGGFLLPGLIDVHVHLGSREALESAARVGITTVVDLGTHPDETVDSLRALPTLPAILSAGPAASAPGSTQIAQMGFPDASGITGPDDAERFLDWRAGHRADLIKIIIEDPAATEVPALGIPTLRALVAGAHHRGLLTVAHVVTAAAFDRGLDAGVDILTHAPVDRVLAEGTVRRMRDQGTLAAPTLVMMDVMARKLLGDRAEDGFSAARESVRSLHAAGIPILAGTDANESPFAPVPHGPSLHDEIGYLQQAGLTVADALRAATSATAAALQLGDRGRLEVGRRADLVLTDRDPLRDPSVLRGPSAVWIAGERVDAAGRP